MGKKNNQFNTIVQRTGPLTYTLFTGTGTLHTITFPKNLTNTVVFSDINGGSIVDLPSFPTGTLANSYIVDGVYQNGLIVSLLGADTVILAVANTTAY